MKRIHSVLSSAPSLSARLALLLLTLTLIGGCESCLKRVPVEGGVELGALPACAMEEEGEELIRRSLVAGPDALEKTIEEVYRIYRRGGCIVGESYVSWRMGDISQIIVWDAETLDPIVGVKRSGFLDAALPPDERAYRIGGEERLMVRIGPDAVERFYFRGPEPHGVIPSGRGLFSILAMRASGLSEGEILSLSVLDLRRLTERVVPGSVRRDPLRSKNRVEGEVGTFSVMGRDTVFTDKDGFVIADLAGLIPGEIPAREIFTEGRRAIDLADLWAKLRAEGAR